MGDDTAGTSGAQAPAAATGGQPQQAPAGPPGTALPQPQQLQGLAPQQLGMEALLQLSGPAAQASQAAATLAAAASAGLPLPLGAPPSALQPAVYLQVPRGYLLPTQLAALGQRPATFLTGPLLPAAAPPPVSGGPAPLPAGVSWLQQPVPGALPPGGLPPSLAPAALALGRTSCLPGLPPLAYTMLPAGTTPAPTPAAAGAALLPHPPGGAVPAVAQQLGALLPAASGGLLSPGAAQAAALQGLLPPAPTAVQGAAVQAAVTTGPLLQLPLGPTQQQAAFLPAGWAPLGTPGVTTPPFPLQLAAGAAPPLQPSPSAAAAAAAAAQAVGTQDTATTAAAQSQQQADSFTAGGEVEEGAGGQEPPAKRARRASQRKLLSDQQATTPQRGKAGRKGAAAAAAHGGGAEDGAEAAAAAAAADGGGEAPTASQPAAAAAASNPPDVEMQEAEGAAEGPGTASQVAAAPAAAAPPPAQPVPLSPAAAMAAAAAVAGSTAGPAVAPGPPVQLLPLPSPLAPPPPPPAAAAGALSRFLPPPGPLQPPPPPPLPGQQLAHIQPAAAEQPDDAPPTQQQQQQQQPAESGQRLPSAPPSPPPAGTAGAAAGSSAAAADAAAGSPGTPPSPSRGQGEGGSGAEAAAASGGEGAAAGGEDGGGGGDVPPALPPLPRGLGAYSAREAHLQRQEAAGQLRFQYCTNDGSPDAFKWLMNLKAVFSRQLPNMPKEYICRLLLDRRHRSVVLLGRTGEVLGGITYRVFQPQGFGEIAFCAVTANEQVKGFGTRLMNATKAAARERDGLTHLLTYADNNAVGYFTKQGFSRELSLPRERWGGYIKDYDGGTLMEGAIHPKLPYTDLPGMLQVQKEYLDTQVRAYSNCHQVHPPLPRATAPLPPGATQHPQMQEVPVPVPPPDIPGVLGAGWSPAQQAAASGLADLRLVLRSRGPTAVPATPQLLTEFMGEMLAALRRYDEAWPFLEPVDISQAVDYHDLVPDPVDLRLVEVRLAAGSYYATLDMFLADLSKMVDNCKFYNGQATVYYTCANKVAAWVEQYIAAHVLAAQPGSSSQQGSTPPLPPPAPSPAAAAQEQGAQGEAAPGSAEVAAEDAAAGGPAPVTDAVAAGSEEPASHGLGDA